MKLKEWSILKNRIKTQWFFPLFVILAELLFHLDMYGTFDIYMLYALIFALSFSAFALLISSTGKKLWNVLVRFVFLLLLYIYFTVQVIYYQVFGNYLALKSILNGTRQAMDFGYTIWEAFLEHAPVVAALVVLLILFTVFDIKTNDLTDTWKRRGIYAAIWLFVPVLMTLCLMSQGTGRGTTYEVKTGFNRMEQSMYRLGLLQTLQKDITENICTVIGIQEKQLNAGYVWITRHVFKEDVDKSSRQEDAMEQGFAESVEDDFLAQTKDEDSSLKNTETQLKYQMWDIDYPSLLTKEENEDIQDVHRFFSAQSPSAQNQYTGMFEGYNLIYITAESFSDVVIDRYRTPTLYRMQQEGFWFHNFYTPSWYLSTIDGEYVNLLSQIPVEGDWSLQHSAENFLPVSLGNQLAKQGYVCNAYHNHDSYYYDRTMTHPNLGYTFKAVGAGLTFESMNPESDLELMELTADEYINQNKPFHTYYMTMSGHLPYTYAYNSMAVKNREVITDKNWSENAACYLAANVELEYALAYLVERLEETGKLDNTLFVIVPDHYPYGLKRGAYDELRGKEVENDVFEIYRNTCIIWSASMKDIEEVTFPVHIDKYCSNLDVLPTVSNLMGLSYDSRLFAGRDMLSDETGLVMLKDYSFITDKVRYNATTDEVFWAAGVEEDPIYLAGCKQLVADRFFYSGKILELDYYRLIK